MSSEEVEEKEKPFNVDEYLDQADKLLAEAKEAREEFAADWEKINQKYK